MESSKVKKKLLRLPSANGVFSKINALLQTTKASVIGASEQTQDFPSPETIMECRNHQLEVELKRAEAEEMLRRIRQRIL